METNDIRSIQTYLGLTQQHDFKEDNQNTLFHQLSKVTDIEISQIESTLKNDNELTFDALTKDSVGKTLFTHFLQLEERNFKIILLDQIRIYQKLSSHKAQINIAFILLNQLLSDKTHTTGVHIVAKHCLTLKNKILLCQDSDNDNDNDDNDDNKSDKDAKHRHTLACCHKYYYNENINGNLFDAMGNDLQNDLKSDAFIRFCKSEYYQHWLKYKCIKIDYNNKIYDNKLDLSVNDFICNGDIGCGKFGLIQVCEKKDCSKLYAIKIIDKKRVFKENALNLILSRKSLLMNINSHFVARLNYNFMDNKNLYFVTDLTIGLDLKYHLTYVAIVYYD